jgi:hypothetical protein
MGRKAILRMSRKLARTSLGTASLIAMAVLATLVLAPEVKAEGAGPCKREAKQGYWESKGDCKEAYQLAKDTCFARDHECVEDCRQVRHVCREPGVSQRDAAIDACNVTLAGAKAECRAQYADGTPERDQCIDQAQVVAFMCRDQAREDVGPELRACRRAFKSCIRTQCPPEVPVDRNTARACKLDAKDIYKACKQDCREEYQLAKDTCLNRDHECVEGCRATRQACRQPIVDVRDAAIDACNAARAAAIDICRDIYDPQTPQRDACVDQAQIDAFKCRDDAREVARPDLEVCRAGFVTCAQACPPPAGEQ